MDESKLLTVEITTPEKPVFKGKAVSLSVPGAKGAFQVLNGHAPIVSTLEVGLTKVEKENGDAVYFVTGPGFAEIHENKASVLTEYAYDGKTIDAEEARRERDEAASKYREETNEENLQKATLAELKLKAAEKSRE